MEPPVLESDQELNSLNSIVHIQASEVYPKKPPIVEDDSLTCAFPPLYGEYTTYIGRISDGIISISNYRLFIHTHDSFFNVPLRLIEQVECRDIFYLHIYCKDARSIRCTFTTNDRSMEWYRRLSAATSPPKKIEDLFAFAYHAWCSEESRMELHQNLTIDDSPLYNLRNETARMGFNLKNVWRISTINQDQTFCPTYPKELLVPASVQDNDLYQVAGFRSSKRIPIVVWRHQNNGSVIARCSQPEVGWLGWRNNLDEDLVQAIAKACASDAGLKENTKRTLEKDPPNCISGSAEGEDKLSIPKILILDARSYAAAVANRAKGGGCECSEYYPNCDIQFMSLANIHCIRKSFHSVRTLCSSSADHTNWHSMIENTKWLQHMSGLLKAAMTVVNAIDRVGQPVIVHCSDGWDRTPQIVALAEIMLDPYYRTIEGFQVLVEREWLEFGHKFGDRCGHGLQADDTNERCPVFLQWLDCVQQLLHQFPCDFEFNENFLVKLVQHTYSSLFGTFLCNSSKERMHERVAERTYSVWAFLRVNQDRFINFLFKNKDRVLCPSCQVRDLQFWTAVYMPSSATAEEIVRPENELQATTDLQDSNLKTSESSLNKTRSCDDLLSMAEHNQCRQRRSSDPNIIDGKHSFSQEYHNGFGHMEPSPLSVDDPGIKFSSRRQKSCSESSDDKKACKEPNQCGTSVGVQVESDDVSNGNSENHSFDVQTDNTAFESSTDTLVGELAGQCTESPTDGPIKNSNEKNACSATKKLKNCNHRTKVPASDKCKDLLKNQWSTVSTSTSDISDSYVASKEGPRQLVIHQPLWARALQCPRCTSCINGKRLLETNHLDAFKATASSSSQNSVNSTPLHSRTPSSGFPATPNDDRLSECTVPPRCYNLFAQKLDSDGLTVHKDDMQERMYEIISANKRDKQQLKQELHATRLALYQQVCYRCNGTTQGNHDHVDEVSSLPDSVGSGEHHSLGQESNSDVSWEQVEENDTRPILWVPDHAVSRCTGCETEFWLGCRKHHCRNCGKIFCANCSSQMVPIPNEQLYQPVRVCSYCFENLCGNQCKQQLYNHEKMNKIIPAAVNTATASN